MDFKPKLVAFDLDGTLASSKERMSAHMGEDLALLLARVKVAVISGAAFEQFEKQFLLSLPHDAKFEHLYILPTNAAQCFVYKNGAWTKKYDHSFTIEEREKILEALNDGIKQTGLDTLPPHVWGERIEDRGAQISFSPLGQHAPLDAKKAWNLNHNDQRKQLWQVLSASLENFSVAMGGLTTIDITQKGINKAYGIRELVQLSGISISEMLYVGDALEEGGNDSVVIPTGVKTHEVFGPQETAKLIEDIVHSKYFN